MHLEIETITPKDIRNAQDIISLVGLVLGPVVCIAMLVSPAPESLGLEGWRAAAIACWMCIWWMTEAIPIAGTALVPLVFFPALGVVPVKQVASSYAASGVLLILGGFMLGAALQRWNLHTRIAMVILKVIGVEARRITAGFMIAAAFLSMWISNASATTVMLPIAISIIALIRENSGDEKKSGAFAACLLIALAYSATVGGMMTLVGTPANLVMKSYIEESYGFTIDFLDWMLVAGPLGVVLIAIAWLVLTFVAFPARVKGNEQAKTIVQNKLKELGKVKTAEWRVLSIFAFTIFLWLFKNDVNVLVPGLTLNDMSIAIMAALLMFVVPSGVKGHALMTWENTKDLPWGVIILSGGAIAMAGTLKTTGVADWMGSQLSISSDTHVLWLVTASCLMIVVISNLMSNTATITAFLPIIVALSIEFGENPLMSAIPATLVASCAFMLPIGTPPNAIVFGSNLITIPQMVRAGTVLSLVAVPFIILSGYYLAQIVFDITPGVLPDWATR